MGRRHVVFTPAEVERTWEVCVGLAVIDEVRTCAEALRDEIRFANGRLDRAPTWPGALLNFHGHLVRAAVQVCDNDRAMDGAAPDDFEARYFPYQGCTLHRRKSDGAFALSWDTDDTWSDGTERTATVGLTRAR